MSENDIALGDHEHPIPVTLLCIHVLLENASGGRVNGSTLVLDCGNRFADTIHFLC